MRVQAVWHVQHPTLPSTNCLRPPPELAKNRTRPASSAPHDAPVERRPSAGEARSRPRHTRPALLRGGNTLRDALSLSREGVRCDDRKYARGRGDREYEAHCHETRTAAARLMHVASWTFRRGSEALDRLQFTTPPPFVQRGSPTALTLGPSSGDNIPSSREQSRASNVTRPVPPGCSPACCCARQQLRRVTGRAA